MKIKLFFVGCGLLGLSTLVHADVWRLETVQPQFKAVPLQTQVSLKSEHGLIPLSEIIGKNSFQGPEDAWFSNSSVESLFMLQPKKTTAKLLSIKVEDVPSTIARISYNYMPPITKQALPVIKKSYKEKTVYMPLSGGFGMAKQAPQKIRFYPFE